MLRISYYFFTNGLLLLTLLSLYTVTRPINVVKSFGCGENMDLFSLDSIKIGGGPSQGGKGHEFPTADYFGNIKNSGSSPGGKGHGFTNENILGDIKYSGPSPGGNGHGFPDAGSLGNIKNSGPSAGGKGHEFPNGVGSVGNIMNAGSSSHGGIGHITYGDDC